MEIRLLTPDDIVAVMRLRHLAGWNQTEHDIRRLIALEPDGCFAAWMDGQIVGTTTTTTYGRELAWIGMVLVDPRFRRHGIATELMKRALAYLRQREVVTIKLDATPAGRPLYERFDFEPECLLERWSGTSTRANADVASTGDWHEIIAIDRVEFGADRGTLLRAIVGDAGRPPIVARNDRNQVIGFALTRPGSGAGYVGPIIAPDIETARSLLTCALAAIPDGPVFIDLHLDFPDAVHLVRQLGFQRERELLRMRLGPNVSIGRSPRILAIAGPEIG
jgi:GNAT superfamily N-acetyltransferase